MMDLHAADLSPPFGSDTGVPVTNGIANDPVAGGVMLSHSIRGPTPEEGSFSDISE